MKVCESCGGTCQPKSRYCRKCYDNAELGLRRELPNKVCLTCGQVYRPTYRTQKCCSDKCARASADQTKREKAKQLSEVVKICARCQKEYHPRLYHAGQQIYCEDCIAFKDRDKCRRRRAKTKGVEATERINDYEIYERDNWICKLCNQPLDKSATWPDMASASIDHIVPLSKGGAHTLGNVQSAHLGCNMVKGNRDNGFTWASGKADRTKEIRRNIQGRPRAAQ